MRAAILGAFALCAGCTTPMLTSVDLTRATAPASLATYGVGVTEVELKQLPYGGVEALPQDCEAALAAYETNRATHEERVAPYVRAVERIADGLRQVMPESGESPRVLTVGEKRSFVAEAKDLATLAGQVRDAEAGANRAMRVVTERCPAEPVRLEALNHVRPSSTLLFGMELGGGAMSNDALKLVTGADGLPTSLTASADDQSGAAIGNVARLIGRFSAPAGGGRGPASDPNQAGFLPEDWAEALEAQSADRCGLSALPPSWRITEMEKRPACIDVPSLIDLLEDILVEPSEYEDMRPPRAVPPVRHSIAELLNGVEYAGLTVRAACAQPLPTSIPPRAGGVVVATPIPCQLEATGGGTSRRFSFVGLSESHLTVVPVDRADLVKNTTTLSFQNGMVTTVDVSRPSVGAAAFGLPTQVISNLVGGVTDAFKDSEAIETARLNQMKAETDRIAAETARIIAPAAPEPAWAVGATEYIAAEGVVATRRAEYEAALAGSDRSKDVPAEVALRNAKALANAAAQTAGRPLPYPELL